mgnify:CR=1 FL=1|jgi:hypothetical protein
MTINNSFKNLSSLNNRINYKKTNFNNKDNKIKKLINQVNYNDLFNNIIDNDLNLKNNFTSDKSDSNNNNLQNLDNLIYDYSFKITENFKNSTEKGIFIYTNIVIRLLQIMEFLFISFGWCLPYNLLKYHIYICVFNLIYWEIFKNKDIFSNFIKNKKDNNKDFIPINQNFCFYFIIFVIFLSLYSIVFPENTIFSYIFTFIKYLSKFSYNK